MYAPAQLPTTVEFVDIAGLVRGASKGEGLGNKFLANIRETDAICQVLFTVHCCQLFLCVYCVQTDAGEPLLLQSWYSALTTFAHPQPIYQFKVLPNLFKLFKLPQITPHWQVVRCFEDDDIVHVSGKVDPLDDVDTINLELALADLAQIEKRLERLRKGEGARGETGG